jgi:hypothetical protein
VWLLHVARHATVDRVRNSRHERRLIAGKVEGQVRNLTENSTGMHPMDAGNGNKDNTREKKVLLRGSHAPNGLVRAQLLVLCVHVVRVVLFQVALLSVNRVPTGTEQS